LLGEIRALPQVLGELMQAIKRIKVEPDLRAFADAMHDRITSINLKVDNSEVIRAMQQMVPDHNAIACVVVEKMKPHVDHSHILDAVDRIKVPDVKPLHEAISKIDFKVKNINIPEPSTIAAAVHDRLRQQTFNVDHTKVLQEIRKIKLDHGPVLDAISNTQVDLEPIHSAIAGINLTVDHSPVLDAIRSIRIPDHQSSIDRLSKTALTADHHKELLSEIRKIKLNPDFDPVIQAINGAEVDFTPIHEAIGRINLTVDHSPVLEAVRKIQVPHHDTIASAVFDKIKRHNFSTKDDHELVLREIRKHKPDLSPIMQAISAADVDLSPVHEAIGRIKVNVDHSEVLNAVKRIKDPDHDAIARMVHERLRNQNFATKDDHEIILKELRTLKVDPDIGPVIQAINSAEVDFTPVLERIENINVQVNNTEVLQAIAEMRAELRTFREVPTAVMSVPQPQPQPPPVVQVAAPVQQLQMIPTTTRVTQVVQPPVPQAVQAVTAPATMQAVQSWRPPARVLQQPGQSLTTTAQSFSCPFCGNTYMDDSQFCRMCGKPRQTTT